MGLSYGELTDPRWCDDRYLNSSCANSNCKHMFVSKINTVVSANMIAYKPSLRRPLYECLNGEVCKHAFCIDCWNDNSKKAEEESGPTKRSRRRPNNWLMQFNIYLNIPFHSIPFYCAYKYITVAQILKRNNCLLLRVIIYYCGTDFKWKRIRKNTESQYSSVLNSNY
jgi:hypothetical protein